MSFVEHLEELRKRIIISLVALAIGTTICFIFKGPLLELLISPLDGKRLITLAPAESFMTVFKVAAYAGLIIASPVIIYQVWAFVSPGLKEHERRAVFLATGLTSLLFLGGIVFGWFLVLPRGLDFLLTYESQTFDQQLQASRYFSFVMMFLLGFGLVFELPAMVLTLARLGLVSAATMGRHRKYIYLAGAVISAALTPGQDLFSMIAMIVPFILLFEVSVLISRLIQKKPAAPETSGDEEIEEDSA